MLTGSRVLMTAGFVFAGCGSAPEGTLPPPELATTFTIQNALSTPIYVRVARPGSIDRNWSSITGADGLALERLFDSCHMVQCTDMNKARPAGDPVVPQCSEIPNVSPIVEIAPGDKISDEWNGYHWKRDASGCVKSTLIEAKPLTAWLCFGYGKTSDGSGLTNEMCIERTFTPGDGEIIETVLEPRPDSVAFALENNSAKSIWVQATVECSGELGWADVTSTDGTRLFPQITWCTPCLCGAQACALCDRAGACAAPELAEILPGQSRTSSWDGYYYEAVPNGPNGASCLQPTYATDELLTARICWGDADGSQPYGYLINPKCETRTFTFGQVSEVRVDVRD